MVHYLIDTLARYGAEETADSYALVRAYNAIQRELPRPLKHLTEMYYPSHWHLANSAVSTYENGDKTNALNLLGQGFLNEEIANGKRLGEELASRYKLDQDSPLVPIVYPFDGGLITAVGIQEAFGEKHIKSSIFSTVALDAEQKQHQFGLRTRQYIAQAPLVVIADGIVFSGSTLRMLAEDLPSGFGGRIAFATNTVYPLKPEEAQHFDALVDVLRQKNVPLPYAIVTAHIEERGGGLVEVADILHAHAKGDAKLESLAGMLRKQARFEDRVRGLD